ncbi:pteridine-dependent deoxygenase [Pseudoxanthomonas sp. CAU 1598]|uniref:Pteridine-dependent deoxygenase n=1 Tax=Pseudomarimonas arenosa TaxID=2774145 RepID=A0AAW3ZHA4_9GAMM|nr:pteridine-dependent deoxygenase [Pseudomarimonas arenosa]
MFGFGRAAPADIGDPRYLRVDLEPLNEAQLFEVWTVDQPVRTWQIGNAQGACSETLCFGWINQTEGSGAPELTIRDAAEQAYRSLMQAVQASDHRHLLRIWNYFDAITEGDDDRERYRQFCVGRAAGLALEIDQLPAATAIGEHSQPRQLQVYWISAGQPGIAIENPRQTPAYHYPRCYGPKSPSFARAMAAGSEHPMPLLISGTASVVGHDSHHREDLALQVAETFRNFDALLGSACQRGLSSRPRFDQSSLLKVYLRDPRDLPQADALLRQYLSDDVPRLFLHGDICRRELLIEIDGFHGIS